MPLRISHRSEADVPTPTSMGRVNEDLEAVKGEMRKLPTGMVLEIETGNEKSVRSAKTLVTRAGNQLGSRWQHWSIGTKVYAKPLGEVRRRVRRRKSGE